MASSTVDLHLRSYGEFTAPDRHDYGQLVLPLRGALLLEVEGRQGVLDPLRAGFVAPGAWHAQHGDAGNRSIIVDIAEQALAPDAAERLFERPFAPLGPASRKLIEFMALMSGSGAAPPSVVQGWVPLLVDTLALGSPRPVSKLAALMARIEAAPGQPWTIETMAQALGCSVSRLHALFREEHDTTPHAWLLGRRLDKAREWLAGSATPIAEIALRAGFSEQSALTRALRKAIGMTPAAYRRQHLSAQA
ncbi:helix-turn-helix transcriptional regulator [Massilia aerilata]|uniref:AraC family transcriptional regulator n=1 Tax=Massilia aerilata TaxID=453817 RepID=A0ABW0RXZ3_9BURK